MEVIELGSLTGYNLSRHFRKALSISNRLEQCQKAEGILLDLSNADWFTPAFLTPISTTYNRLSADGAKINIKEPNHTGIRFYLNQIGFPEGYVDPSKKYDNHLPLCHLNTDSDEDAIDTMGRKLKDLLQRHFPDLSGGQIHGIHYPLSEIIDNVDQHSDCASGAVLVQNYPKKKYLDICIVDDGISIPGRFQSEGIQTESESEAVKKALAGEISTSKDRGHRKRGFGIRTTFDLVCEGLNGTCILSSKSAAFQQKKQSQLRQISGTPSWDGTIFIARLDLPAEGFNIIDYVT